MVLTWGSRACERAVESDCLHPLVCRTTWVQYELKIQHDSHILSTMHTYYVRTSCITHIHIMHYESTVRTLHMYIRIIYMYMSRYSITSGCKPTLVVQLTEPPLYIRTYNYNVYICWIFWLLGGPTLRANVKLASLNMHTWGYGQVYT